MVWEILGDPFNGIGKPEPLRHHLRGCWSRRLTEEDRIVYRVEADTIHLLSARFHYPRHR
jgi:toxin YoeB